jgi:hypothetical protein
MVIMKNIKRCIRKYNRGNTIDLRNWSHGRYAVHFTQKVMKERDELRAMNNILLPFFRRVQFQHNLKDDMTNFNYLV